MIEKCPQCISCIHYEMLECDVHGNLKNEAYKDKCKEFEEDKSDGSTYDKMKKELMKQRKRNN